MTPATEKAAPIPASALRERLSYDEDTGVLRWTERPRSHFPTDLSCQLWNARMKGKLAFSTKDGDGYLKGETVLEGRRIFLKAHRVVWAVVHGEWPAGEIDHINGVRDDNRITNLRVVTRQQNLWNARKPNSGPRCVRRCSGGFYADIRANGKILRSPTVATAEAAQREYLKLWETHRDIAPEAWALRGVAS